MTNDEIETRITVLETKVTALTVMLHCVLPATVPAARPQILHQFGQYCSAMETRFSKDGTDPLTAKWHLELLAPLYESLEGAIKMVAEYEARKQQP